MTPERQITITPLEMNWLQNVSDKALCFAVVEYRYLVHRFSQWLAMLIARSDQEKIRQLLLSNLVDELGGLESGPTHLELLDRLLESMGVTSFVDFRPKEFTHATEEWFTKAIGEFPLYDSLCILGPGTEEISYTFLEPLENAIKKTFFNRRLDLRYFDVHRGTLEDIHVEQILQAIMYLEEAADKEEKIALKNSKIMRVEEATNYHKFFWDSIRNECQKHYGGAYQPLAKAELPQKSSSKDKVNLTSH
jgi:hypothetical protein